MTYTLEPAGSHGVWGLDDHSFLPYVFGSAQYGPSISGSDKTPTEGNHPHAPDPADVTKLAAVERLRESNMYFAAIGFIYDVKTGPFWEHSPTLYDISGVRGGWGKINKVSLHLTLLAALLLSFAFEGSATMNAIDENAGHDQNVQRRSSLQVPRRAAFPLRLPLQLGP